MTTIWAHLKVILHSTSPDQFREGSNNSLIGKQEITMQESRDIHTKYDRAEYDALQHNVVGRQVVGQPSTSRA
jgi:hypothetical protein